MAKKYILLANLLRDSICRQLTIGDDKMPTEESICQEYGYSRQTVRRAYLQLEEEGLITRRKGSGTYLTGLLPNPADNTIAILLPNASDYIYAELFYELKQELQLHLFQAKLYATDKKFSAERDILNQLLEKPPRGLIAEGIRTALPNPNKDLYLKLQKKGCPILFLRHPYIDIASGCRITGDYEQAVLSYIQLFTDAGRNNIGIVLYLDDQTGIDCFEAWCRSMSRHGLPMEDSQIVWCLSSSTEQISPEAVESVMRQCNAVICQTDELAFVLEQKLLEKQVQIPNDIAIASFDNSYLAVTAPVPFTSMSHEKYALTHAACDSMLQMLKGLPASNQGIPWKLVVRRST